MPLLFLSYRILQNLLKITSLSKHLFPCTSDTHSEAWGAQVVPLRSTPHSRKCVVSLDSGIIFHYYVPKIELFYVVNATKLDHDGYINVLQDLYMRVGQLMQLN